MGSAAWGLVYSARPQRLGILMDAINDHTASMADFGLEGWMIEVFLTVFVTLVAAAFLKRFLSRLRGGSKKTTNPYDDALVASAERPMVWLVTVWGSVGLRGQAGVELSSWWIRFARSRWSPS